jgi:cell division protein FtsL
MDCKTFENDIISLKMKKRIIEDHIKVLKSKESHLLSKNRIENIAMESFGMYSPSPEPLIVKINE